MPSGVERVQYYGMEVSGMNRLRSVLAIRFVRIFASCAWLPFVAFVVGAALLNQVALSRWGGYEYWLTLPLGLAFSAAVGAVLALLLALLPSRRDQLTIAIVRAAAMVALVVTVFFPGGVSRLDGSSQLTRETLTPVLLAYLGYILAAIALVIVGRRYKQAFARAFCGVAAASVAVVVFVCGLCRGLRTGHR
jgi:hypothetical protein